MYPHEMAEAFRAFDPIAVAEAIMQDNTQEVLDKNRQQLYEEGIDAQGIALPAYSGSLGGRPSALAKAYYAEKVRKNPRVGANPAYDGKDTGDTYETLTLDFQGEDYSITPHTDYAVKTLGEQAFGHTEKSQEAIWNEIVCDGMIDAIAGQTGAVTG